MYDDVNLYLFYIEMTIVTLYNRSSDRVEAWKYDVNKFYDIFRNILMIQYNLCYFKQIIENRREMKEKVMK